MDEPKPIACPCAEHAARRAKVAEDTHTPLPTVEWIGYALAFAGRYQRRGVSKHGVDAGELCRMLVADTGERRPGPLRDRLLGVGIPSSEKVGQIVYAMVDADLCKASPDDKPSDFDSIFDAGHIEKYLSNSDAFAVRDWPTTLKSALMWAFYTTGLAVLVVHPSMYPGANDSVVGGGLIGAGWLLSKWKYPQPMRFGWPWSTLSLLPLERKRVA
jgi:hypothetical protein